MERARLVASEYSVLSVPTKKRKSRFSLLQLEHGELFLNDFSGDLVDGKGARSGGRLRCCSRSLVFEPNDPRAPLLRFPLRRLERLGSRGDGRAIAFECGLSWELFANSVPAPFLSRRTPGVFSFAPAHAKPGALLALAAALKDVAARAYASGGADEARLLADLTAPLRVADFKPTSLVDYSENVVQVGGARAVFGAERVTPLLRSPGVVVVTTKRLYFEPAALNNVGDAAIACAFDEIASCRRCRHMMAGRGLELELRKRSRRTGLLRLAFPCTAARDGCFAALRARPELSSAFLDERSLDDATRAWQTRDLDNFGYLALLNQIADRSLHDLSQYPVYP